jgi:hypothetical protein
MSIRVLSLLSLWIGCAGPLSDVAPGLAADVEADRVADGTLEAFGIVALLNDASTTLAVLDDEVPLNRTTAENLLAHRQGPDGLDGTADDDLFDSVAEVDAVSWVGPAALDALEAYVLAHGWVPDSDELLDTFDGVPFTAGEAVATLALANTADSATLDDDLALDSRAMGSILDARPIATMSDLAGLYFVGPAALSALRDAEAGLGSYHDQFVADEELEIPDDGTVLAVDLEVQGTPGGPFDVTVFVDLEHDALAQVWAQVEAPDGTVTSLFTHASSVAESVDMGTLDADGVWTLYIGDAVAGDVGVLRGFAIEIER